MGFTSTNIRNIVRADGGNNKGFVLTDEKVAQDETHTIKG